jgi:hypothetical protein
MPVTPAALDRVSASSMLLQAVILSRPQQLGARLRYPRFASASVIICGCQVLGCAGGFRSSPEADIVAVEPTRPAPAPIIADKCAPIGGQQLCVCANGVDTGQRTCVPAAALPTQGTLTQCLPCDAKPISAGAASSSSAAAGTIGDKSQPGTAGNSVAGAGSGGSVTAGTGALGSSASTAGATAGSSSAGAGGAASNAGATGRTSQGPTRIANPLAPAPGVGCECSQPCFPFGVLACCRMDGTCGCTWAPGAYCL